MIAVGIREIKNRLSEYLRRVREGEVVLVTDRGKVVAQLTKPNVGDIELDTDVANLEADGLVSSRGRDNSPEIYAGLSPVLPPGSAMPLLDADREER